MFPANGVKVRAGLFIERNLSNGYCLNVRGVKGKKRKPKGKPDNPAQSARFMKAAKALGVDESGEAFEKAMRSLLKPKRGSN
jgi:hypothetical protein